MSNHLNVKCRPKEPTDNLDKYVNNFYVASKGGEESYYSPSDEGFIKFKTPTKTDEYRLKGVYDITDMYSRGHLVYLNNMKILLFHVSDGKPLSGKDNSKNFFLEGKVSFKEILDYETCKAKNFSVKENDFILIITFNTNKNICEESLIDKINIILKSNNPSIIGEAGFLPEEGGGGVIIKHP